MNATTSADLITPTLYAHASRPRITTTVRVRISATRYREEVHTRFADVLLIDRLAFRGQITARQYAAACRLYGLWIAGNGPSRTTQRYDVAPEKAEEYAEAVEGEESDGDAWDEYQGLLRDAGAAWAAYLAGLCRDQHPGTLGLTAAQEALDWLADGWGMER